MKTIPYHAKSRHVGIRSGQERGEPRQHGIDFVEAQALWINGDPLHLATVDYDTETRELLVGRIGDRCWPAVVTYRGSNTRIISVRRSRTSEEMAFLRGGI